MPAFDIIKENKIDNKSFRVNAIKGMFDFEENNNGK